MILNILFLLLGLALILVGANMLTDGASAIARRWGVSDLVIGLTVVAFGTSAPELVISLVSAIEGATELAIGNAVGSNIFNVLAIIGITSIISPLKVDSGNMTKDIPFMIVSALVLLAMGNGPLLNGAERSVLTRVDGIVLLLFFCIFMRYTFSIAHSGPEAPEPAAEDTGKKQMGMLKGCVWVVLGLAGLIFGGNLFVKGASGIAAGLGVSQAVIGLTIVAAGTSLPELATSIAAALKGKAGMAVGNVIGSNIFNIFMVLGAASTIRPLQFGGIGNLDLLVMTGACLLFWLMGWKIGKRTITRGEGILLTVCYVAYLAVLVSKA